MPRDGDGVRAGIDGAEEVRHEPPRALFRELPPPDPFPVEALGSVLSPAAKAIQDRVRAPMAVCGQSVLGAGSLAVQGHADVALPIGHGESHPLCLYLLTLALSGERKTAADRQATWPIRTREKAMREQYDADLPSYENKKAAWDRAREYALKAGKGDKDKIRLELEAIGPAPRPPLMPMLTSDEPTMEGLYKAFGYGWPSHGLFSNEGGSFIGGHGMRDEAKLRTAAALSVLWDGQDLKRVRAGEPTTIMPGRRLSFHLMAQPAIAQLFLSDQLLTNQGLLSRILVSDPESTIGKRFALNEDGTEREERPDTDAIIKKYGGKILGILEKPLPLVPGKANELDPRSLSLSSPARIEWKKYSDSIERQQGTNGDLRAISGLASKMAEHAARIAAVLTLVRDIETGEIPFAEMEAGIRLADHYTVEALRLFGAGQLSGDLLLAKELLEWLLLKWDEPIIALPNIYQFGPNAIRESVITKRMVAILEDHGWLRRIPGGAIVRDQYRRDAWLIIKAS